MSTAVKIPARPSHARWASSEAAGVNPYFLILAVFAIVHALLILHDIQSPAAFLSYDRAGARIEKIATLIAAPDTLRAIVANSAPGDYIFQALPYWLAGPVGMILFQLLLGAFGTVYAYRLSLSLLGNKSAALAAALLYVVLPGSLWTPHVLASEAIANPLLAFVLFQLVEHFRKRIFSAGYLLGLAALGIVLFVRMQFALLPILIAAYGFFHNRTSRRAELLAPLICFAPLAIWSLVLFGATGTPFEPTSDHGLSAVLHQRVFRAAAIGGFPSPAAAIPLGLAAFLDIFRHHPAAFFQTYVSDFINLTLNPGLSGLSNYLGWFAGFAGDYWTNLRDKAGYVGVAREILSGHAAFATLMIGGTIAWGLALLLAARGAWAMFVRRAVKDPGAVVVATFIVYLVSIVFITGAFRWTHRTPLDPILVTLIVLGVRAAFAPRLNRS